MKFVISFNRHLSNMEYTSYYKPLFTLFFFFFGYEVGLYFVIIFGQLFHLT